MTNFLEDYEQFASQLGLVAKKKVDGEFIYVDKYTGDIIHPSLLGRLFRLVKQSNIDILNQEINSLEYYIIKEKHKLKELPSVIKQELQREKDYIKSLKEEINVKD